MIKKCPVCAGQVKVVKKKIVLSLPNPGELVIEAVCDECQKCSEEFLDENQSEAFAKKVDETMKGLEDKKPINVSSGSIIT